MIERENAIYMYSDFLQVCGFKTIQDEITFCLYPGGIVITQKKNDKEKSFYYTTKINKKREIRDFELLKILENRGWGKKSIFIKVKEAYIELEPHGTKKY